MKKLLKLTAVLTVIALLASCFAVFSVSAAVPTTTKETINEVEYDVYTVGTAQDLIDTVIAVNALEDTSKVIIRLSADITLNEYKDGTWKTTTNWTPLADFSGIFDGNHKTIYGLYLNSTSNVVGLIAKSLGCTVKDLTIENAYLYTSGTKGHVGAVIGSVDASATGETFVSNVKVTNTTVSGDKTYIGGLVGGAYATLDISNVYVDAIVSGYQKVGGFVGGSIKNTLKITNAVNASTVTADASAGKHFGAMVGVLTISKSTTPCNATLTSCINLGKTYKGTTLAMANVIGYNDAATVALNSCTAMTVEGSTAPAAREGGTGTLTIDGTTAESMKTEITTKTRDELAAIIKTMGNATGDAKYTLATEALAGLFGNDMVYAQIRESDNAIRFVAPITGKDYKAVGMTITATYNGTGKSVTRNATTLYKTITETKDGATTHTTAVENEYFYCFVLTGAPEGVTFEITTFVTVDDGSAEGITYTTGTYTATYTAGTLK